MKKNKLNCHQIDLIDADHWKHVIVEIQRIGFCNYYCKNKLANGEKRELNFVFLLDFVQTLWH
jgi:hypothetical protein